MTDETKLQYIRDYERNLQELCGRVARERKMSGDQPMLLFWDHPATTKHSVRRTTDALLNVARTTVFQIRLFFVGGGSQLTFPRQMANHTRFRMRLGVLSFGEHILASSDAVDAERQVHRECMERVRSGTDCEVLWNLEKELQTRLKKPVGWSRRLLDYAKEGLQVVAQGGLFVLQTAASGVIKSAAPMARLYVCMHTYALGVAMPRSSIRCGH